MSVSGPGTETWQAHLAPFRSSDPELLDEAFFDRWGSRPWKPEEADRRAAYLLHIQLTSRVATQPISDLDGMEEAVLNSILELFSAARNAAENNFNASHFDAAVWHVFNKFVRPFTAKWHRQREVGPLSASNIRDEFRADLVALQRILARLDDLLLDMRDGNPSSPAIMPADRAASVAGTAVSSGSDRTTLDALIMKGGGVKGLAFAGAIRELEQLYDFRAFVGTSAGAIAAALLAAGATGAQLEEKLRKKPFRDFLDGNLWTLPVTLWTSRGLHPGYAFLDWLNEELNNYIIRAEDIKMKDLPRRAVLYASMKGAGEVTFDKEGEHRDTAVHTAVRCSMSIPYFFQPQWVDSRRVYDGGLLHNYPVQIFLEQERQRNPGTEQPDFIALYLGSTKPRSLAPGSVLADLFSISIDRNDSKVIDRFRSKTVMIDTEPIGTIDFDLTDQEKDFLVLQGRAAALEFLTQRGLVDRERSQLVRAEADRLRTAVTQRKQKLSGRFRKRILATVIAAGLLFGVGITLYRSSPIRDFFGIAVPSHRTEEACTLSAPTSSEVVREKTAQEILSLLASVDSWRRDSVFNAQYSGRFIARDGWSGTVDSKVPDLKGRLCQFMVSEERTKARILVNTCERTCNFRKGDDVVFSGWLLRRQDDYIEIAAERHSIINKGVTPTGTPQSTASGKEYVICHGEEEFDCAAHAFQIFERCGKDNGVRGADPNVSGKKLCGNAPFKVLSSEGGSIDGGYCGYSWFKIACD